MLSDMNPVNDKTFVDYEVSGLEYDKYYALSVSALLAQGDIPTAHKRIADNYMIMKKVFGLSSLQKRISNCEKNRLAKYDFSPLEFSTLKQINQEIEFLQKWSLSLNPVLKKEANEILAIRVKELKFLTANKYAVNSNEMYDGYLALEKYFETISNY